MKQGNKEQRNKETRKQGNKGNNESLTDPQTKTTLMQRFDCFVTTGVVELRSFTK
jgi:hypothetical protein